MSTMVPVELGRVNVGNGRTLIFFTCPTATATDTIQVPYGLGIAAAAITTTASANGVVLSGATSLTFSNVGGGVSAGSTDRGTFAGAGAPGTAVYAVSVSTLVANQGAVLSSFDKFVA